MALLKLYNIDKNYILYHHINEILLKNGNVINQYIIKIPQILRLKSKKNYYIFIKNINRIIFNYYKIIDKINDKIFRYILKMKILNQMKIIYYLYYFKISKHINKNLNNIYYNMKYINTLNTNLNGINDNIYEKNK